MSDINRLMEVDFRTFFIDLFVIIFAIVAMAAVILKFCELIGRPIKWFKGRNTDHELLANTIANVTNLQQTVEKGMGIVVESQNEIKKFYENRLHDREQSFKIQKELLASIGAVSDANAVRDSQIQNLMIANKELLADRINQKYKYYISIGGIPEDEYDEFVNMHKAYNGVGGNSRSDAKFEYCISHLPLIPVETKLKAKSKTHTHTNT